MYQQKDNSSSTVWMIALIIVGIVGYWLYSTHTSMPSLSNVSAASNHTVTVTSQPLSASAVNTILCNAKSPACGTGVTLYNDAVKAGIADSYALAVFKIESSYGTAGVATVTHSLGNIKCTAGYSCYAGFRSYATWQDGYNDWFQLINNVYVKYGLTTVNTITVKYAPPSDNNNTQQYIDSVINSMDSYSK